MTQPLEAELRYPIGKFNVPTQLDAVSLEGWISDIEKLPAILAVAVKGLSEQQLDTEYRPGGWTVRQVVHHLADSHINSYVRYRLALTEDIPLIKGYNEAAWAELPDATVSPINVSMKLLDALHERWATLLHSMSAQQYARSFEHPERGAMRLDRVTALYAWHSRHHVAHITQLRIRRGW